MVQSGYEDQVLESLKKNIVKNKGHLDTGILATPLMLDILSESGNEDLAFTIMNQRDFPGYGDYIIGKKATTLWEYWDGKLSHSHPMYGSVIRWFFKYVAGINPDPQKPGFKQIIIKPRPSGDLTYAKAGFHSLYGKVLSEWEINDNNLEMRIEIPANTTATVYIPASNPDLVQVNNRLLKDQNDLNFRGMENGCAVVVIGSGKYNFNSADIKDLIKPVHVSTPQIIPKDTLFLKPEKAEISINSATDDADIYYTLDGTAPSTSSPKYKRKITVTYNTEIKAKAFKDGSLPSFIKKVSVQFVDPAVNGLNFTVYEGDWVKRPDTTSLRPVSKGISFKFDLNKIPKREDYIAIEFNGYLDILEGGDYTFYASANDGCVLNIDSKVVVDNAGYKGKKEYSGQVKLSEGKKSFRILYYENSGSETIDIYYSGPGFDKRAIPPQLLYREKDKK